MQVLLKTRHLDIEPENFGRERILTGKFLRTKNPPPPGRDHRPIINFVASETQVRSQFDEATLAFFRR
jgi:hypothetical protein